MSDFPTSLLAANEGDVVVIHTRGDESQEQVRDFARSLHATMHGAGKTPALLIFLPPGMTIESHDRDVMRAKGWVRVEEQNDDLFQRVLEMRSVTIPPDLGEKMLAVIAQRMRPSDDDEPRIEIPLDAENERGAASPPRPAFGSGLARAASDDDVKQKVRKYASGRTDEAAPPEHG